MIGIKAAFSDAFFFTSNIIATYWCMCDFFIGSVSIFIISKYVKKYSLAVCFLSMIICLAANRYWITVCFFGYLLRIFMELDFSKRTKNIFVRIVLLLLLPLLIRHPESRIGHLMNAVASVMFFIICFNTNIIKKILSFPPLVYLGGISFNLFLIHTPVNILVIHTCWNTICEKLPLKAAALLVFIITVVIDIGAYVLLDKIYKIFSRKVNERILTDKKENGEYVSDKIIGLN